MNKLIILPALVFVAGLFGCEATPYQRLGVTPAGGYSEKAMSQDRFHVKFSGNNHTPPEVVRGYLYRRAAEVTLRYGFLFFTVARGPGPFTDRAQFHASKDSYDDVPPPIEIDVLKGNQLQMVIQCFKEIPEQSDRQLINAEEYLERHVRPKTE